MFNLTNRNNVTSNLIGKIKQLVYYNSVLDQWKRLYNWIQVYWSISSPLHYINRTFTKTIWQNNVSLINKIHDRKIHKKLQKHNCLVWSSKLLQKPKNGLTVHFIWVYQILFGDTFLSFFFRTDTFMICVNVLFK